MEKRREMGLLQGARRGSLLSHLIDFSFKLHVKAFPSLTSISQLYDLGNRAWDQQQRAAEARNQLEVVR